MVASPTGSGEGSAPDPEKSYVGGGDPEEVGEGGEGGHPKEEEG